MKRITFRLALCAVIIVALFNSCGSKKSVVSNQEKINVKVAAVGFYNLENLFDTINQPNRDEEFLPKGAMRWTKMKYEAKLKKMAYAISQIGLETQPNGVSVLGVSEIENKGVLHDLVKESAMAKRSYKIVHFDSPDKRGIDVGLLYNPRHFVPTASKSYGVQMPDTTHPTRDVLVVSGYLFNEKIHFLVNHWPSRYGGSVASSSNRERAAACNKHIVDSLYRQNTNAKIIIMGDLNDDPYNKSVSKVLGAKKQKEDVTKDGLYNPFWKIYSNGVGSLAYRGHWNLFDQIILSYPLLQSADKSNLTFWKAEVFNKNFLIQQEGKYRGSPLRTHGGGIWLNGYSDHLPTIVYLVKEK